MTLLSRTAVLGSIWMLAYWAAALFLNPASLFLITNVAMGGVAVGVVIAYGPSWIAAVQSNEITRGQHLVLGIVLAWMSDIVLRTFAAVYRTMGSPPWLLDHPIWGYVPGFALWLGVVAGILHMTVRDAVDNRIPQRQYIILGIVIALVVIILGGLYVGATVWNEERHLATYAYSR